MDDWDDDVQIGAPDRDIEGHDQNDEPGPEDNAAAEGNAAGGATKTRRKGKPRPKLTLDLLKEPQGINDVFCKFPDAMQKQFRGKGHEVGDLQRLLEMYARWQQRVFPFCKFDDFILKLEKLGSSAIVKNELRELRQGLVKLLAEEQQEEEQGDGVVQDAAVADAGGELQRGGTGGASAGPPQAQRASVNPSGAAAAAAPRPLPDDDDEEQPPMEDDLMDEGDALEALQEEQWANALEAMPDFDEQLFGAQPPGFTAHDNIDKNAAPTLVISQGEQAREGGQQQQVENGPMQEDLPVADAKDADEEDAMDDDEILRQADAKVY